MIIGSRKKKNEENEPMETEIGLEKLQISVNLFFYLGLIISEAGVQMFVLYPRKGKQGKELNFRDLGTSLYGNLLNSPPLRRPEMKELAKVAY